MGNIVLLDDSTINKIAAGEVIERPASVIKEMVENSIDAGATNINIEIKNGGISYIRVSDNGKGIQKDDMEIAFERHATSKIRQASDLDTIKSMGFRGEALASIAAIANVEMVSRYKDEQIGNKIVVEAGKTIEFEEIGCPVGTSITVKNLFFNTPVRYKFLKKDFTEAGYIEDVVTRIALVNPNIAIKLINSGKTVIQTSGNNNLQDVIYAIYGKDVASNVLNVDYTYEDLRVTGVIGKPEIARSNRSNQMFFVNKRYIKDKVLTGATEKAFKGMIPIGKYGFVVLNIEMNPSKVDVNVHPAKLEVRFAEENNVFKCVYHAIQETFLKAELVSSPEREIEDNKQAVEEAQRGNILSNLFSLNRNKNDKPSEQTHSNIVEEMYKARHEENSSLEETKKINADEIKNQIQQTENNIEKSNVEGLKDTDDNSTSIGNILVDLAKMKANIPEEVNIADKVDLQDNIEINKKIYELDNLKVAENFDTMYEKTFGKIPASTEEKIAQDKKEIDAYDIIKDNNISVFEEVEEIKQKPDYKFIGIAFSTYIIVQIKDEMYIIDQHAAHERILYEKIKKNYYSNGEKESQLLLLPDVITLTHKEMDIARDNMDIFEKAGFDIEEFGENTIKLNGVPTVCYDLDTKELFLETLDEINTVARTARQEIEERFIETVACKAAVKAHMSLDKQEVDGLMTELLKLPNPFTCPHGRPTAIKMDKKDIEKKFARRK
jgi:DNA mismatch repair protein MutL